MAVVFPLPSASLVSVRRLLSSIGLAALALLGVSGPRPALAADAAQDSGLEADFSQDGDTAAGGVPTRIAGEFNPRIELPGHMLQALAHAQPVALDVVATSLKRAAQVELTVVFRRADRAGFESYLRDVYDPKAARYLRFLTQRELAAAFGPTPDDYERARDYFRQYGFHEIETSANRMTLTIGGTRDAVDQALGVQINDYKLGEKSFYANANSPSLPAAIANQVEAIIGLSNLSVPSSISKSDIPPNLYYALCAINGVTGGNPLSQGILLFSLLFPEFLIAEIFFASVLIPIITSGGDLTAPVNPFPGIFKCVNQYNTAHNLGVLTGYDPPAPAWQGVDGTGQTVGLLQFDTFDTADIANYLALIGRPAADINKVTRVHVGAGATAGDDQQEVLLDIVNVLTAAPGASIVVFDAPFSGAGSFQAAFNAMINANVDIISNSWAYCEDQTTQADVRSIDSILQTAAASGISVFSGTGDRGSTCLDGSANTVHVPASSPNLTAVGGTSMTRGEGFTYGSETWWGASGTPADGQGGFGVSRLFARPAYQNGTNASPMRSIPDIAINADPKHGVIICQASNGGCPTGLLYGGTSSSAPTMAALMALLNQSQGTNLGFLNPQIYPLASTDAFHDAASMASDFAHVGLGSPNLSRLHQKLTNQTAGAVDTSVSNVVSYLSNSFVLNPSTTGGLLDYADGTSPAFVIVRLRDAMGNAIDGKTVSLAGSAGHHAVITPASGVTSTNDGSIVFRITNLSTETVTFTATDVTDGVVLPETAKIQFMVPPAASAGIAAFPASVANDGAATSTITITMKDALNRATPGKRVTLTQGSGRSIIAAPSPAVTDAGGQIQFTVTDRFAETVTYTAVIDSDNRLTVPGNAVVTFGGNGNSSCSAGQTALTPAPGYAVTVFATGFFTNAFNYSNVNWGCGGATNPGFDTNGNAFISDFPTGKLYRIPNTGKAVTDADVLSTLGLTAGQPVFGKDGRLYVSRSATGSGFSSGVVIEVDANTGAVVKTLATGLTCPGPLAVDPVSGDLFFTGICFGGGSDDPSLHRIQNPSSATPTSVVYATLSSTPNGSVTFAPDGTIFVGVAYTTSQSVVQISGTNIPGTPTQTTLNGVHTDFPVTVGETLPSGAAKSLLVHINNELRLVDVTVNPVTSTLIVTGPTSTGVIGPDGCIYAGSNETVIKIAPSAAGCGFLPGNPSPALEVSPAIVTPDPAQGALVTFTARFKNTTVPQGTPVVFDIAGANQQFKRVVTDASGAATFTYSGRFTGKDSVAAVGNAGATALLSNTAQVTWTAGPHMTSLNLDGTTIGGSYGKTTALSSVLRDLSLNPSASIVGQTVHFTLGAQSCDAQTDGNGIATCSIPSPGAGVYAANASYAGNGQYQPASATTTAAVLAPVRLDVDGNGQYDALTDGLLIIRSMFGLTGTALTGNAIGPNATRSQPADVLAYLAALQPVLDIDGNGQVDALTDGLMILRYMFGLRGASITANALGSNPTRSLSGDIEGYLSSLMPPVN